MFVMLKSNERETTNLGKEEVCPLFDTNDFLTNSLVVKPVSKAVLTSHLSFSLIKAIVTMSKYIRGSFKKQSYFFFSLSKNSNFLLSILFYLSSSFSILQIYIKYITNKETNQKQHSIKKSLKRSLQQHEKENH